MSKAIRFGKRLIGEEHAPLIIAEMSGNHNQSLDRALNLVDAAAECGAHAIKLQTYTPEIMTLDCESDDFIVGDPKSLWHGRTLFDLYREAHTPWEWHEALFERARSRGMECLSTPFDPTAVAFLERFNPPAYKVASFEITDLRLVAAIARAGRPVILSTGMATAAEIDDAVRAARENGAPDVILLKCTSTYPASPASSNVATIPHMRELFHTQVGISDHTAGVGVAIAAVALGATVVEKHFTLRRADGGVDAEFSLEPSELALLVEETERAWRGRGTVHYGTTIDERGSLIFRRSIYVSNDVRAGDVLTAENIRIVRPGYGLAPRHYDQVLGRRVARDARKGTPVTWDLFA